MFWIGSGLTLFSTLAASFVGFNFLVGWLTAVCLWTVLSGTTLELSSVLNRFQLGLLLYSAVGLSLGLGYFVGMNFSF